MVLVALLLDVIANRGLIAMFADRTREVTAVPKLAAPKALFNHWAPLEYFSGSETLHYGHDLCDAQHRH